MEHIYFLKKDVIDSEPDNLGITDEGYLEFRDTIDVYTYDLSLFNGKTDDLDYMVVDVDYGKEDSPACPYISDDNYFYRKNKEFYVDSDTEHSAREMVEIYKDLSVELGHDNVTKDDVKKALTEIRTKGRAK